MSCALCMASSLTCLTYIDPILTLRLKKEKLPVWAIGLIFSIDSITYTATSMALNFIPEKKKNYSKIVTLGTIIFVFCMFVSGPIPLLPDEVYVICLGILIGGISGALVNNNCVPALNQILAP